MKLDPISHYLIEPKDTLILPELDRQAETVSAIRYSYPKLNVFAVPNGAKRTKAAAIKAKLEGMESGPSDLVITWDGGIMFAECKDGTGMPTDDQHNWLNQKIKFGFNAVVFRSSSFLIKHLHSNGAPLSRMTMAYI